MGRPLLGSPPVDRFDPSGFDYGAFREFVALLYLPEVTVLCWVKSKWDAGDEHGERTLRYRCIIRQRYRKFEFDSWVLQPAYDLFLAE